MKSSVFLLFILLSFAQQGMSQNFVKTNIFEDTFEDGYLKAEWSAQPNFNGQNGVVEVVMGIGMPPSNWAVRLGKSADENTFTTNVLDLHLELSSYSNVELFFNFFDGRDEGQSIEGIYLSDDSGSTFTSEPVLKFVGENYCDYEYGAFPPISISKLADIYKLSLNDSFVIRFMQRGTGDFAGPNEDGWYLDNVLVYEPGVEYLSDFSSPEGFEAGTLNIPSNREWAWRFADSTAEVSSSEFISKPSNLIEVSDLRPRTGTKSLYIGKSCDDGFSTNALDLHLDLDSSIQAVLSFWLLHLADETSGDNNDAIFFSNNGGESFVRAFEFEFNGPSEVYSLYTLDLKSITDSLVSAGLLAGPGLTDSFIVRFQQRGESDFVNTIGPQSTDGYYLDDISISRTITNIDSFHPKSLINVYPIPAKSILNLEFGVSRNQPSKIALYSLLGREYQLVEENRSIDRIQFNMVSIPSGIYVFTCWIGGDIYSKKILVE
jgi:hypothetical protein